MLQLTLLGGNSAIKIKDLVRKNFDFVEVAVFPSISQFCTSVESRSLVVDRLILLQDALTEDLTESTLRTFESFLSKHYPSIRLITIVNNLSSAEMLSSIFLSPLAVHILMDKMKPRVLSDLVSDNPSVLKSKYGFKRSNSELQDYSETLDSGVATFTPEQIAPPTLTSEPQVVSPNQAVQPKKKGLFSIFSPAAKQAKGAKAKDPKPSSKGRDGRPLGKKYAPYASSPSLPPTPSSLDTTSQPQAEVTDAPQQAPSSLEGPVNFSFFDKDTQIGLGVDLNPQDSFDTEPPEEVLDLDSTFETGSDFETDSDFETASDQSSSSDVIDWTVFNDPPGYSPEFSELSEDEQAALDSPFEQHEPFTTQDDFVPLPRATGLEFDDTDLSDSSDKDPQSPEDLTVNTEELTNRLSHLANSVFAKELNLDISDVKTAPTSTQPISVSDVEEETSLFTDVDSLTEAYEQENVRVVENVVERVVERVVTVDNGKRHYRNGIRLVVVTGDRKTGVTSTALNLAAHFGQQGKTLFVDLDLKRRGSLLYIGLDLVASEEEHVRSGLKSLNHVNALQHITYPFPKGGFDCLTTILGVDIPEDKAPLVSTILQTQRLYKTIVIDCPIEHLAFLKDMLPYSEVVVCTDSNLAGVLNTVLALGSAFDSYDASSFLFNNGHYFLSRGNDLEAFRANLDYVSDLFSLAEEDINWGVMHLAGSLSDVSLLLAHL